MDRSPRVALALVAISTLVAGCGGIATPPSNQQTAGATQAPKPAAKAYRTPSGRTNPAMAYDPQTHEVLMVGGMNGNTPVSDMWAWDGTGWSELSHAKLPPQPADAASSESPAFMTYDARTSQMVMVTLPTPQTKARTWIWDGHNWSERHPVNGTPEASAITYDASLGKILMMGADFSHVNPIGITWAWDGTNWASIQTPHVVDNPQVPVGSLTYDAATRQVLYLTQVAKPTFKDITWIFDGQDWIRSPAPTPLGDLVQLVYDDATASLLYIGGNDGSFGQPSEGMQTWSWDGSSWLRVSDAPTTFGQGSMGGGAMAAYDAARRQVVLFGGITPDGSPMNQTWTWDGHTWTQRG